jgi:hypothetical protein
VGDPTVTSRTRATRINTPAAPTRYGRLAAVRKTVTRHTRLPGVPAALARHRLFCLVLAAGLAARVLTMAAFPPAIWFGGDSASYLSTALRHAPGTSRLSGYGIMLLVLGPFHSFALVTAVQHLLGLAMAVMIYALLRHRGLPAWGAALATLPVVASAYQLELEQEILPSAAFGFLVLLAVTLAVWWGGDGPLWATVTAGALLAASATFWPVGLPLLALFLLGEVARRAGWRRLAATGAAAAVPLAGYLLWFDHTYHHLAFSESDGVYLWSRTMSFADCAVIRPPPAERRLCPRQPTAARPAASSFIWEPDSPLDSLPGKKFSPATNALALDFALRAIAAQPGGYAAAVRHDAALSFAWNIPSYPSAEMTRRYEFRYATTPWISPGYMLVPGHTVRSDQLAYGGEYGTRAVPPFAGWLAGYQRFAYLRGTLLGVILLAGLAGIARSCARGPGRLPGLPGRLPRWPVPPPRSPGRLPRLPGGLPRSPGRLPGGLPRSPGRLPGLPGRLPRWPVPPPGLPGRLPGLSGGLSRWARRLPGSAVWMHCSDGRLPRRDGAPITSGGAPGLFPWLVSVALLLVPVMTADYSERYVLIAVPTACLSAALAFAKPVPDDQHEPARAHP